ncbi:unnamed protein product [Strongylus vulgaris]|uniref:Uncharacterized protein n=1 Tax=Strongylus vulgaris TaxID=40348 RepID=A0A3P7K7S3_STRVU|nr:unnamed protein product [Strongylus vulgaris]
MMAAMAPGPDHVSADFLRAGGHAYTRYLGHLTSSSKGKDFRPVKNLSNRR